MNEITQELHREVLEKFKPVIEKLAQEGKDVDEIVNIYIKNYKSCLNNYYRPKLESIGSIIAKVNKEADSTAELIFYDLLIKNNIKFEFQKTLGVYRIDYMIDDYLIIELDGIGHNQQHDGIRDAYCKRLGYKILRVKLDDAMLAPEIVIKKIKQESVHVFKRKIKR